MKKNDWWLIFVVCFVSLLFYLIYVFVLQTEGNRVVVKVRGELFGTFLLDEDQTVQIGETNVLRIEGGKADMVSATCPDLLCVHQRAISRNGETLVCLPNQVVVEAVTEEESEYDSIAQ